MSNVLANGRGCSRRDFLRLSATLSAGALLVACAPAQTSAPAGDAQAGSAEKTQVLVWDQFGSESAGVDEIVALFNEAHPDIEVTREAQTNMRDILKTALDAGTGPDIMYYDTGPGFAGVLARAGLLLPLDDAYAEYGWNDRIMPIAKERAAFDGKTYGVGNEVECIGAFYNERIFEELNLAVPETHDDFLALCETIKGAGLIPIAFGNQAKTTASHLFSIFSGNTAGKDKLAAAISGETPWTDPDFVQGIQIPFVDMVQAGYFNSDINAITNDDANLLLYNGQAVMNLTGSWRVGNYTNPETMADPVGFFFYPPIDGKPIAPPAGLGSGYFVSQKTTVPEACFEFVNFLFSDEAAKSWLEGMAMIPPIRLNADEYDISDLLRFVLQTLETNADQMGFNINVLTPEAVNTMMNDGFQEVIGGTKTAEQQATDMEAAMQQARDEGKVMDITN